MRECGCGLFPMTSATIFQWIKKDNSMLREQCNNAKNKMSNSCCSAWNREIFVQNVKILFFCTMNADQPNDEFCRKNIYIYLEMVVYIRWIEHCRLVCFFSSFNHCHCFTLCQLEWVEPIIISAMEIDDYCSS